MVRRRFKSACDFGCSQRPSEYAWEVGQPAREVALDLARTLRSPDGNETTLNFAGGERLVQCAREASS
jgi:hypothetical protein